MSLHIKKGLEAELFWSQKFHYKYIPVLVSSKLLRRLQCGQIDIAFQVGKKIILLEIKQRYLLTANQQLRLMRSQSYLSQVFEKECVSYVAFGQKEILPLRGFISTLNI